jgi:hypothetical protein
VGVEQPTTVKVAEAIISEAPLAVSENVPHCVGTALMVSTKGVVSVYVSGAHVTVVAPSVQFAG